MHQDCDLTLFEYLHSAFPVFWGMASVAYLFTYYEETQLKLGRQPAVVVAYLICLSPH